MTSKTLKAGAVICRPGEQEPEVLLLYRKRLDDWSFPKGHCEAGETNEETMLREVKEETGLSVKIRGSLPPMEYQNDRGEMRVEMFLAVPLNVNESTRAEHEGDVLEWVPLSKLDERLSYQNLKEYIRDNREELVKACRSIV